MNLVLKRFGNNISYQLYHARQRQRKFERLLLDRPTGEIIRIRTKSPEADLKRRYYQTLFRMGLLSVLSIILIYAFYPEYTPTVSMMPSRAASVVFQNIPETRQMARAPAPPRPQVPLAVEGEEVPDDVTIESTELNLDSLPDIPQIGMTGPPGVISEEPMDYAEIDYKPHPNRIVTPEYPEEARKKRIEGRVMVKVLVDKEGKVEKVEIVDGPEIFRAAALSAAKQFGFRPGKHAGERRKVWMVMPIEFSLK